MSVTLVCCEHSLQRFQLQINSLASAQYSSHKENNGANAVCMYGAYPLFQGQSIERRKLQQDSAQKAEDPVTKNTLFPGTLGKFHIPAGKFGYFRIIQNLKCGQLNFVALMPQIIFGLNKNNFDKSWS